MSEQQRQIKNQVYWDILADKIEEYLKQHAGKPAHLRWVVEMLHQGDTAKVKADYWHQRENEELYSQDLRKLLDVEFE